MAVTLSYPPEVSELQEGIDFFWGGGEYQTVSPVPLLQLGVLCYSATQWSSGTCPVLLLEPRASFPPLEAPPASDKFKARAVPLHRGLRAVTILWAAFLLAPLPQ